MSADVDAPCPCGSDLPLGSCCLPLIRGAPAQTAEALMRSRYTAYVLGDAAYLLDSWHPETRPDTLDVPDEQRWLGLKIKRCEGGGSADSSGTVEFVARFKIAGTGHRLHEKSNFVRTGAGWKYVDGELIERPSTRRRKQ